MMKNPCSLFLWLPFALVLLGNAVPPATAEDFFFRDGDVVVMIGDSITEQHLYSNYVEMWTITRFPAWKLTFRNVGIGGDRSTGGRARFQRDVLVHHPTAMTVDFGMNDASYGPFKEDIFQTYVNGLQGIANQAKDANIRVAWVTPQPLDGPEPGPTALVGYNQTLERFCLVVQSTAKMNNGLFVDQFHPYLTVLDKARQSAPKYDRITGGDAVHPGPTGQALMAASILKGLHLPPLVSAVTLDATKLDIVSAKNCKVTDVIARDGGLTFKRHDAAIPFFPSEAADILKHAPILEELNEYRLQISGLQPGSYEIRLQGTTIAKHSADELDRGVNLATASLAAGPIAEQVHRVKTAVEKKNAYHHDQVFRPVVLATISFPDWLDIKLGPEDIEAQRQTAYTQRMSKMPELDNDVWKALETKPYDVEIIPSKTP